MASSIHNRRSKSKNITSKPHYSSDSDSSNSPHSISDSNSSSSSSSSRHPAPMCALAAKYLAAAVVASLVLRFVLPPSLSMSQAPRSNVHEVRTIDLRTKDPLPFSELLKDTAGGDAFGATPLTGSYRLGRDSLLHNNAAGTSGGSIEFPPLDLWSVLSEETTNPENRLRLMMHLGLPGRNSDLLRKGSHRGPDYFVDSFLGPDSKFDSVVAASSHRVMPSVADRAVLTRRGYKPGDLPNQDRVLIANFVLDDDGQPGKSDDHALLMGIFDGHGARGHAVSHWCALELPRTFAKIMRQNQSRLPQPLIDSLRTPNLEPQVVDHIKQSLIEAFLEVDAHEPVKGTAGSTASTLFYPGLGSKVYIANAGDSTTLIAAYSKSSKRSSIVFQNTKHKPHLKEERQRIEKAGGTVMIPPSVSQAGNSPGSDDELRESSRVVIPDMTGNPFGGLALAMSRSIGDFDGKAVGLIAEPDVFVWDMNEHYTSPGQMDDTTWFAVVASDGVYDLLKPQLVVEYLGSALNDRTLSPLEACERIIREASRLWMTSMVGGMPYRDDISIGISKIEFSLL